MTTYDLMSIVDDAPQQLPPLKPDIQKFVASLLENSEVEVLGASRGPVGKVIHSLFSAAQKVTYALLLYVVVHGGWYMLAVCHCVCQSNDCLGNLYRFLSRFVFYLSNDNEGSTEQTAALG